MDTKEIRDHQVQTDGMAASFSQHTLWQTRRATGVDDVDAICRLDRNTRRSPTSSTAALDQGLPFSLAIRSINGSPWQLVSLPVLLSAVKC